MDVEKLVEEIRNYPVLYDQANEKYKNAEYKERVWKIIATTLEVAGGVDECKKKWASIRDQLRRTLQKRKTKSGQTAAKIRKYKYEDILAFLLPYLGEREGLTNVPQVCDEEDVELEFGDDLQDISSQGTYQEENLSNIAEQHTEGEKNLPGSSKDTTIRSRESSKYQSIIQVPSTNQLFAKKDKFEPSSATRRKISRREVLAEESPASQLMAYILAEKEAAFLCGIAPTLKSLDVILLNEAKGKIFNIVQELELRQLQLNAGNQARYFVPNYSTSTSPVSVQSPSPLPPAHLTSADQTKNHNEHSFYQF